jgi:hypothetical protein
VVQAEKKRVEYSKTVLVDNAIVVLDSAKHNYVTLRNGVTTTGNRGVDRSLFQVALGFLQAAGAVPVSSLTRSVYPLSVAPDRKGPSEIRGAT